MEQPDANGEEARAASQDGADYETRGSLNHRNLSDKLRGFLHRLINCEHIDTYNCSQGSTMTSYSRDCNKTPWRNSRDQGSNIVICSVSPDII